MPLTGDEQVVWLQVSMNDGLQRTDHQPKYAQHPPQDACYTSVKL